MPSPFPSPSPRCPQLKLKLVLSGATSADKSHLRRQAVTEEKKPTAWFIFDMIYHVSNMEDAIDCYSPVQSWVWCLWWNGLPDRSIVSSGACIENTLRHWTGNVQLDIQVMFCLVSIQNCEGSSTCSDMNQWVRESDDELVVLEWKNEWITKLWIPRTWLAKRLGHILNSNSSCIRGRP